MRWSCALVGFVVIACGGGPAIKFADFAQDMQHARCERLARCALFPDEASCETYFRVVADPSLAGAVDAKKVDYDGERAKQCADAIAAQSCDLSAHDQRTPPAACGDMLRGKLAGGEMCSFDAECASGTCNQPSGCPEVGCCVGMCRPTQSPAAAGGGCAKTRDCASGLVCGKDQMCHPLVKEGEDCRSDRECADGLGCINPLSTMPGTCRPLPHVGEPCPYLRCADENLRCDENGTHNCVALGLSGAACASATDCSPYLECDATSHQCRELPTLGMACATGCGGESFCFRQSPASTGMCITPQPDGAACQAYNECESYYCEPGTVFDSCKPLRACF